MNETIYLTMFPGNSVDLYDGHAWGTFTVPETAIPLLPQNESIDLYGHWGEDGVPIVTHWHRKGDPEPPAELVYHGTMRTQN